MESTVRSIFVNVEAVMKRYIERNFNGNVNGNLYEIAHTDDFFVSNRLPFITAESLSEFDNKADCGSPTMNRSPCMGWLLRA